MSHKPQIVLVYPKTGWDVKNVTSLLPLSVLYLVKPLKQAGFNVIIIDQRIDEGWKATLSRVVTDKRTIAVGISAMTGLQIRWGLEAAKIVRDKSGLKIIWGGVHPSLLPSETLKNDYVDIVVLNEGESTIVNILNRILDKKSFDDLVGVAFHQNGSMLKNESVFISNLDEILIPDYSAIDVSDYFTTQTLGVTDLAITTSRGCPNRCAYCYNIPYSKGKWRAQSAEWVVKHIKYLTNKFAIKGILVKDDNFFVSKKRVENIANGLSNLNKRVLIRAECRADYIARKWEPDFLEYLAFHGFKEMTIGAESGSDKTLDILCKDISVDDIRITNRRLGKAKIAAKFTFMTGYPGEKAADIKQTLNLMLELLKENPLARVTPIHLYAPYPGTKLFSKSLEAGYRPPDKLEKWAQVNFHELKLPWINSSLSKKLERASIATYFLDGKTVPEYFSSSVFMRILARFYGYIVRFRVGRFFFHFMPEIAIFEWIRKKNGMVI